MCPRSSRRTPAATLRCSCQSPCKLEEGVWEVGLLSLPMHDAGLQLDELTAIHVDHLIWVSYLADDMVCKDAWFTVDDLTKTFSNTNRVGLMKSIVGMFEWR